MPRKLVRSSSCSLQEIFGNCRDHTRVVEEKERSGNADRGIVGSRLGGGDGWAPGDGQLERKVYR